ncbi:MAG: VCBS repeat-containing protein, partial [Proteobacteria bacterium]|nr:VCBS repeat-containing protein [Pseudomonadota bacterium]
MEGTKRATRAAGVFLFVFFYGLTAAYAATEHLPPGFLSIKADVNGDRRDDVILQPRTAEREASLLLGIGDDVPAMFWQRLNDIDPELAWDEARAALVIADFNGDERDDIYVQGRAPGNLQAMLTANPDGSFTTTTQKFSGEYMGFDWAAKLRNARAGDFDGDGRDELLMQGAHADDVHPIIRPNAEGILNSSGPAWIDGYLDLRWNANDAELHVGDFNGDGRDDLLWRRLAKTVSGEPAVAFLAADANGEFTEITQEWDKDFLGAEWDPATHDIRIGDINGDGRNDLVGRHKGYLTTLLATGRGGFERKHQAKGFGNYEQLLGVGDITGDGRNDLVARRKSGLHLYAGAGGGSFAAR